MARKHQLRVQRAGTVINVTAKQQESDIIKALVEVIEYLGRKFDKKISLVHEKQWYLKDIVAELRDAYPETEFHYHFDSSSIRPDGGILYIQGSPGDKLTYPILIAEVKNQGTNVLRAQEGLPKQAKENGEATLKRRYSPKRNWIPTGIPIRDRNNGLTLHPPDAGCAAPSRSGLG